jgi:hypothetical protein
MLAGSFWPGPVLLAHKTPRLAAREAIEAARNKQTGSLWIGLEPVGKLDGNAKFYIHIGMPISTTDNYSRRWLNTHTCAHTYMRAHTHTYARSHAHMHTHTNIHTQKRMHMYTYAHTCIPVGYKAHTKGLQLSEDCTL